jgi:cysteine-rich repeat protein
MLRGRTMHSFKQHAVVLLICTLLCGRCQGAESVVGQFPSDNFGSVTTIYGSEALVSTVAGRVYVLTMVGNSWEYKSNTNPAVLNAENSFGRSPAMTDGIYAIGAPYSEKVLLYTYDGSNYVQTDSVSNPSVEGGVNGNDNFGFSVAISTDFLIIGCESCDPAGSSSGSVYAYPRSGNTVAEPSVTVLVANPAGTTGDNFGSSVSISLPLTSGNDAVVVGAPGYSSNRGAVYYCESDIPNSSWDCTLLFEGTATGDAFGTSVSYSRDLLVVGSPSAKNGGSNRGKAFVYLHSVSGWSSATSLALVPPSETANNDFFGNVVSAYSNGAKRRIAVGTKESSKAAVYEYISSAWERTVFEVYSGAESDAFGTSVGIFGSSYLVSAPHFSEGANTQEGIVFFSSAPGCGNGVVEGTETCDDSNESSGDGCNSTCGVESEWSCSGAPSVCHRCGDGLVNGTETCDDNNGNSGDGCNSTCGIEAGWTCAGNPSVCQICGDSLINGTETCDDGNVNNGDGCNSTCGIEAGWACIDESSICQKCGNGVVEGTEACDDGNLSSGDGCNSTCGIESGFTCAGQPSVCQKCFNGIVEGNETCDDANGNIGDGCSSTCSLEPGWTCSGNPSGCQKCFNGQVEGTETCDDNNGSSSDGCNSTCGVESGWVCAGSPSICHRCGDGLINGTETCDDSNGNSGDGCNSTCSIEAGWTCAGENPSVCQNCHNGIVEGTETCDDNNGSNGDGCNSMCGVEAGWSCSGTSGTSICLPILEDSTWFGIEDHSLSISLKAHSPLPLTCVSLPSNGVLFDGNAVAVGNSSLLLGQDNITFVPSPNFHGNLSFSYIVQSHVGQATVYIVIAPVDDPPPATTEQIVGTPTIPCSNGVKNNSECAAGYVGECCFLCDDNYYRSEQECLHCGEGDDSSVLLSLVPVLCAGILLLGVIIFSSIVLTDEQFDYGMVCILTCQFLAEVGQLAAGNLPEFIQEFYDYIAVITLEFQFSRMACFSGVFTFYWLYMVTLLALPLVLLFEWCLMLVIALLRSLFFHRRAMKLKIFFYYMRRYVRSCSWIITFLYYITLLRSLQMFSCMTEGGIPAILAEIRMEDHVVATKFLLAADPVIECYTPVHYAFSSLAFLIATFLLVIYPLWILIFITVSRPVLYQPLIRSSFGNLFEGYRRNLYFVAPLELLPDTAFAIASAFFWFDPLLQIAIVVPFVGIFIFVSILLPYRQWWENLLQFLVILTMILQITFLLFLSLIEDSPIWIVTPFSLLVLGSTVVCLLYMCAVLIYSSIVGVLSQFKFSKIVRARAKPLEYGMELDYEVQGATEDNEVVPLEEEPTTALDFVGLPPLIPLSKEMPTLLPISELKTALPIVTTSGKFMRSESTSSLFSHDEREQIIPPLRPLPPLVRGGGNDNCIPVTLTPIHSQQMEENDYDLPPLQPIVPRARPLPPLPPRFLPLKESNSP